MKAPKIVLQLLNGLASASAFPCRERVVDDLRGDADRQFRARFVLHAGGLHRAFALTTRDRRRAAGFWAACRSRRCGRGSRGARRDAPSCAASTGRRNSTSCSRLSRRPRRPGPGAVGLGGRRTGSAPERLALRAPSTSSASVPAATTSGDRVGPAILWRSGSCSCAPAGVSGCGPRPRTARWSARSASIRAPCSPAVFVLGTFLAGARRRAADAARAGEPRPRPRVIGEAFVVVVVGGIGIVIGAFVAAVLSRW